MVNNDVINEYGLQDLCLQAFARNIDKQEPSQKLKSVQKTDSRKKKHV